MGTHTLFLKYLGWRDRNFPVGALFRNSPYALVFKTTNYCWYKCPHCCECSGPDEPHKYIPANTVCNYLDQASHDPFFSKDVVFTGGEIMSAYKFAPDGYVPQLLNKSMDLGFGTDIKTNAAWVNAAYKDKIFDDLYQTVVSHKPYGLQISLSLDNYHKNSLENNTRLLLRLANMQDMKIQVSISGFKNHPDMMPDLLGRLKSEGIDVSQVLVKTKTGLVERILINEQILLRAGYGTLFDGGRAKNLENAYHTDFPQFSFMLSSMESLVAFDSMGRVTLGENSGRKISTKWHTIFGDKSLMRVRLDLLHATWREETRARLISGWRFAER